VVKGVVTTTELKLSLLELFYWRNGRPRGGTSQTRSDERRKGEEGKKEREEADSVKLLSGITSMCSISGVDRFVVTIFGSGQLLLLDYSENPVENPKINITKTFNGKRKPRRLGLACPIGVCYDEASNRVFVCRS